MRADERRTDATEGARNGRHAGRARLAAAHARRSARAACASFPQLGEPDRDSDREPAPIFRGRRGARRRNGHGLHQAPSPQRARSRRTARGASISRASARPRRAGAARACASASGETAIEIGEWTYEVHETAAGIDLYEDAISWTPFRSAAHAHSAGQALARLHLAARRIRRAAPQAAPAGRQLHDLCRRRSGCGDGALSRCASRAGSNAGRARLRAAGARTARAISCRACAAAARARAAVDAQRSARLQSSLERMRRQRARATAIIDFGLADRTNAVHDLAHAIERNIVEWLALVARSGTPRRCACSLRSSARAARRLRIGAPALSTKKPPRSRP